MTLLAPFAGRQAAPTRTPSTTHSPARGLHLPLASAFRRSPTHRSLAGRVGHLWHAGSHPLSPSSSSTYHCGDSSTQTSINQLHVGATWRSRGVWITLTLGVKPIMPEGDAYLGRGVPGGCLEILGPNTAPRTAERPDSPRQEGSQLWVKRQYAFFS